LNISKVVQHCTVVIFGFFPVDKKKLQGKTRNDLY